MRASVVASILAMAMIWAVGSAVATAQTAQYGIEWVISAEEAHQKATAGELLLVDIRTPAEWRATGIPQGADRSDWWQEGGPEAFLADIKALIGADQDRPMALICARGSRSRQATQMLRARGFTAVFDVREGMLGSRIGYGWLANRLPTTPCPDCE